MKRCGMALTACLMLWALAFAAAAEAGIPAVKYTSGGYAVILMDADGTVTEDMRERIQQVFFTAYPKMDEAFGPAGKEVTVVGKADTGAAAAYTSGNQIVFSTAYLSDHPEDWDVITHELMHVVQRYPSAGPAWLTEGVADYGRFLFGLNNQAAGWHLPESLAGAYYTDGYTSAAEFLRRLEEEFPGIVKEVNERLRAGSYADAFWQERTGSGLDALWQRYSGEAARVTVYQHSDFCGFGIALGPGEYALSDLNEIGGVSANDCISSLKVPAGYAVIVYEHDHFQGESARFSEDAPFVGTEWNDRISSIIVQQSAERH